MTKTVHHFIWAVLLPLVPAPPVAAGTYQGLEPGVSSKAEADGVLGLPTREIVRGEIFDYDPGGDGRRISVGFRGDARIIEFIELEPDERYSRSDYREWFELGKVTLIKNDGVGNRVEYYLAPGVSLHFAGPDTSAPVAFFRHFDRGAFALSDEERVVEPAPVASGADLAAAPDPCDAIHGAWRWRNGAMVECFADGTCAASNGFGGPWQCLGPPGRFEIQWSRPGQQHPYVDTLEISVDGWELAGRNQSGQGVGGNRPEFAGGAPPSGCDALLGSWLWSGGAIVECSADGTCKSNRGLSGPWRCINRSGRFEIRWGRNRPDEFIDSFLISPLGTYLTGRNQYGVAIGATRQ